VSGRAAKLNLLATTVDAFHRSGFAILTMTVWTEATKKIVSGILRFLRWAQSYFELRTTNIYYARRTRTCMAESESNQTFFI